jgi:hypothetical protein
MGQQRKGRVMCYGKLGVEEREGEREVVLSRILRTPLLRDSVSVGKLIDEIMAGSSASSLV